MPLRKLAIAILIFVCIVRGSSENGHTIKPSAKHDPGLRDLFNAHGEELRLHGHETLRNKQLIPNNGILVGPDPKHPAPEKLLKFQAFWKVEQRKRNFVLIVEDMQEGYSQWVDYAVPGTKKVLNLFRALNLPVVWSNYARRSDDGLYNAVDRFYGPQGIQDELNSAYVYGEHAAETLSDLRPLNDGEWSRTIQSNHLNKFVDLDEDGREILYPMLKAWGVNTIVMTGSWTDMCVAATVFDAVDRYGFDVVLVTDAVASATVHGANIIENMCEALAKCHTADDLVRIIEANPDKVDKPKDKLHGSVYKNFAKKSPHTEF